VDRIRGAAARILAKLPPSLQLRLSRRAPIVVDGPTLDPALQMVLALNPRHHTNPLTYGGPEAARARFRREILSVRPRPTPVAAVREMTVDGGAGPITARHYAPPGNVADAPLLVYFHGGGYMIGDLDTADDVCRLLSARAGQHVLSIAYRLAPEHPFPAAIDDGVAAFRWAQAHAAELGADPARVCVGGDSAGGNLAAVVAQGTARDHPPAAQLLIYPHTDGTRRWPSWDLFAKGFFLDLGDRFAFSEALLAGTGCAPGDPRVDPLLAPDLSGLAPALVVAAGFDVLRDESLAYAAALARAGTRCTLHQEPSLGHGFTHLTAISPACARAVDTIADGWRKLVDAVKPSG
jgi:acetyl esterase